MSGKQERKQYTYQEKTHAMSIFHQHLTATGSVEEAREKTAQDLGINPSTIARWHYKGIGKKRRQKKEAQEESTTQPAPSGAVKDAVTRQSLINSVGLAVLDSEITVEQGRKIRRILGE